MLTLQFFCDDNIDFSIDISAKKNTIVIIPTNENLKKMLRITEKKF